MTPENPLTSKPHGGGVTISTKKITRKQRKLSREILGLLAASFLLAFVLQQVLSICAIGIVENYLFTNDIILPETQLGSLDNWIFNLSLLVSVIFFVLLFLFLLGERLSYIREILKGIDALQNGQENYKVPLEGRNELTQLAEAVNYLSHTQQQVKEKERTLQEEQKQFIRALSHDIRTPLTSIMSYSELLSGPTEITPEEQTGYLKLIRSKAGQIKDMTDILLDSTKRDPEHFENARFLMEQLAGEFEEMLEADFSIETRLDCPSFPGTFDVQELRRVFDNLISNVQKYAEPKIPVKLSISLSGSQLVIHQENAVRTLDAPAEGHRIGLRSIQRIVQNYAGKVETQQDNGIFSIIITLSEI